MSEHDPDCPCSAAPEPTEAGSERPLVLLTPEMFGGGANKGKLIRLSGDFFSTGRYEVVRPKGDE